MTKVAIQAKENGPDVVLVDGQVEMALCRCGQSSNKPFCDGTHHKVGFKAEGQDLTVVE